MSRVAKPAEITPSLPVPTFIPRAPPDSIASASRQPRPSVLALASAAGYLGTRRRRGGASSLALGAGRPKESERGVIYFGSEWDNGDQAVVSLELSTFLGSHFLLKPRVYQRLLQVVCRHFKKTIRKGKGRTPEPTCGKGAPIGQ